MKTADQPSPPRPRRLIERLDLRQLTRDPDKCLTTVAVQSDRTLVPWLTFGQLSRLDAPNEAALSGWRLAAYMPEGVVDGEGDSAYALSFYVAGLTLAFFHDHQAKYRGVIVGDVDNFSVPPAGWDPLAGVVPEEIDGESCRTVQHFHPPPAPKLFHYMRGRVVEITVGQVYEAEFAFPPYGHLLRNEDAGAWQDLLGLAVEFSHPIELVSEDWRPVPTPRTSKPWAIAAVDPGAGTVTLSGVNHREAVTYPVEVYPDELLLPRAR